MDEHDVYVANMELLNLVRASLLSRISRTPTNDEQQLLDKLKGLVTNIQWSPAGVVELFEALLKRFESTAKDRSHLLPWLLKMLDHVQIHFITPSWRSQEKRTLLQQVRDLSVTEEELKKCLASDTEKTLDEILKEIRYQQLNQIDENLLQDVKEIVSSVYQDLESDHNGSGRSGLKKDLLKLCQAVKKTFSRLAQMMCWCFAAFSTSCSNRSERSNLKKDLLKLCQAVEKTHFRPRLTQMVSWCIMALSKTGRLIQVGTGEGKSCIVAMFAAFRAMQGEKVDIMSSSKVLAERDMNEWKEFYKNLDISVDCNTNSCGTKKVCYKQQVVYGTVEQFAGDWLKQHFHRMDIFSERTFQCVIVDEVDSSMLDKGHHTVYLGDDMPTLQHLNPLLGFIWATVNEFTRIGREITVGRKHPFHSVVLDNIKDGKGVDEFTILRMAEDMGILAKGSVQAIRKNPTLLTEKTAGVTANQLEKFFKEVEKRFPTCHFALHCRTGEDTILKLTKGRQNDMAKKLLLMNGGFCQYMYTDEDSVYRAAETEISRVLHFTPCRPSQDKQSCYVPGFLSDLVKAKLKVWIRNAFKAHTMSENWQYVIRRHGVLPVDYSCTGVVENNMKWTDGLHQFLEMKEGKTKLSDMTIITNYMSNVSLLQKYGTQIFGITGTLGQQAETETLQKIYEGVTTCRIPSFKRRKLFEVEGIIVDKEEEWLEKICSVVTAEINPTPYRAQRAVLVICETIDRAKRVHEALRIKAPNKKLYIDNNMDNTAVFAQKLTGGQVIISTNLAGRGTDLKVCETVKEAGGLFVVQTFLPKNARVEAQAFGRTARQGSPGSAQLIVCSSHLSIGERMIVLLKKLKSVLKELTELKADQEFLIQLRFYQESHSNNQTGAMLSALSDILSKNSEAEIKTVKKYRDDSVATELACYLESEIPELKKNEELFNHYLHMLDDVYKCSENKPRDSDVSALNEFWGLWLLTKCNMNDSIEELKHKLTAELEVAREKLRQRESPSSNLHFYAALGNEHREKGDFAASIRMYTKAIQVDHCWAAIAFYYRAFASLTQQQRRQDPNCIRQAADDLKHALESVELCYEQIKGICSDSTSRLYKHIEARHKVLCFLKENIKRAIMKISLALDLRANIKVDKSALRSMAPVEQFLSIPLTKLTYHMISKDQLMIQQCSSQSSDITMELQCLESLGLTHVYT